MLRAGDQISSYTLERELGHGAFGVVWLAQKRTSYSTTKFAIKLLKTDGGDISRNIEAFKKEIAVWEQVTGHPNVLSIIEADEYQGQIYIVSEYAPDGTLTDWLVRHHNKAPSFIAAVDMTIGILDGLDHLHT